MQQRLNTKLTLKQNKIDKLQDKVSVKIIITLKKRKENHQEDASCKFKNSDVPPANCLIKQYCKSYCGVAANEADSVEKIKISKTHEINASPEIHMSTHKPKKEATLSNYGNL